MGSGIGPDSLLSPNSRAIYVEQQGITSQGSFNPQNLTTVPEQWPRLNPPGSQPSSEMLLMMSRTALPMDSRNQFVTTAPSNSSFMPGNRPNKYMKSLGKKQQLPLKSMKGGSSAGGKREANTAQINQRSKMRKYCNNNNQYTSGYATMVALNGGETLGEQNRQLIDEYLGIAGTPPDTASVEGLSESEIKKKQSIRNKSLKKLQQEQKDIESKLKFIDSLINQQQVTQVKYIGGGILKRTTSEDFVVNLEQYTRAMQELKVTMNQLHHGEEEQQIRIQSSQLGIYQRVDLDNLIRPSDSSNGQFNRQTYQQFEEMLSNGTRGVSRQVLSVIPTAVSNGNGSVKIGDKTPNDVSREGDEIERVSASSHYTGEGRLYDSTLQQNGFRKSIESNRSSSFVLGNKFDTNSIGDGSTAMKPKMMHSQTKALRSYKYYDSQSPQTENQKFVSSDIAVHNQQQDHKYAYKLDIINEVRDNPIRIQDANSALRRVDLVFENDESKESTTIEAKQMEMYESKAYKARTQVTNPIFKHKFGGQTRTKPLKLQKMADRESSSFDQGSEQMSSPSYMRATFGQLPIAMGKQVKSVKEIKSPIKQASTPNDLSHIKGPKRSLKNMETNTDLPPPPFSKPKAATPQAEDQIKTKPILPTLNLSNKLTLEEKRLTQVGKTTSSLNRPSQQKVDVIDQNVIYQQDGDMSRGVLYFKNLDSLKSFLLNKKRPIYSRKGNKVYATDSIINTGVRGKKNQTEIEEERNQAIQEDIKKKRSYLHKTLTNLMPSVQLKSLQDRNNTKFNFQQTMDLVQKKFMNQTTNDSPTKKEMTWAPISKIQQYPFEDIMNPEGIIDLRILSMGSPSATQTHFNNFPNNQRCISRQDALQNHLRSDSSPGFSRRQMSRRLQTFYGVQQHSNLDHHIPTLQHNRASTKQHIRKQQSPKRVLTHNDSDKSLLSDSQATNSSRHTVTRQIVFFKTSANANVSRQDNLAYMVQYPLLRPRLNHTDEYSMKPLSHTVGLHQQMNSIKDPSKTGMNDSSISKANYESSLLRMSRGIERNKIRDPTLSNITDVDTLGNTSTPEKPLRKHVIFSSYEGVKPAFLGKINESRKVQTANMNGNYSTGGKKVPPLHPVSRLQLQQNQQLPIQRNVISPLSPNKSGLPPRSIFSVGAPAAITIAEKDSAQNNSDCFKSGKNSFSSPLSNNQLRSQIPSPKNRGKDSLDSKFSYQAATTQQLFDISVSRRENNSAERGGNQLGSNAPSSIPGTGSLKGLMRYNGTSANKNKDRLSAKKMDLNIAQHKFSNKQML